MVLSFQMVKDREEEVIEAENEVWGTYHFKCLFLSLLTAIISDNFW